MKNSKTLQQVIRQEAKRELARRNFWDFCLYVDPEFFEKRLFLKIIADAFMRIHNKEINRLSVSMPPRAGKSYITSLFCAWSLGVAPTESVMRNTCTARLYNKFSYDVRDIVRNQEFKDVFPNVELSPDHQAVNGWNLTKSRQVGYFGAGVGGTIIGFGATKLGVTDDMYKSLEDALSENQNEKVLSWSEGTHGSRLEKSCPQIDIGTRWHKNDLIGRNMAENRYDESIIVPALDENGETFCEDVKTTKEYLKVKDEIDSTIWDAEYMQEPVEAKGLLFPPSRIKYFKPDDARVFESSLAYGDIADEGSDNTSVPNGRNVGDKIYITDVVFNKEISDITIPLVKRMLDEQETSYARIEANSMGAMYGRNLKKEVKVCKILPVTSSTNKHTRILMDAGFILKYVYFLEPKYQSDEYREFMRQLVGYMKDGSVTKDDAPDSLSGLVIFIRGMLVKNYA